MSQANTLERPVVTVTAQAAAVIKAACEAMDPPATVVHLSVHRQGDTVAHRLDLKTEAGADDLISDQHDLAVSVSSGDVPMLTGAEVDYIPEGDSGKFVVSNPNIGQA
jgi:Fe-S cluster assembly iron-binding protein IscA